MMNPKPVNMKRGGDSDMDLYVREKYFKKIRGFYRSNDIIKVITGVRRCGKSTLMKMIANELKAQGVPTERILYLDLDQRKYSWKISLPAVFRNQNRIMSL